MIATVARQQLVSLRRQRIFVALVGILLFMTAMAGVIGWMSRETIVRVYDEAVRLLADACSRVTDGRHALYLALAGALVDKGAALEHIPAIVRAVAKAAGNDPAVRDRVRAARSTIERASAGDVIRGYGTLRMGWPRIAAGEATDHSRATSSAAAILGQPIRSVP